MFGLALTACDDRPKVWTAWAYPSAADLTVSETVGSFNTFEFCQEAAIERVRSYEQPDAADYECGYMCQFDPAMQINVCKETRK